MNKRDRMASRTLAANAANWDRAKRTELRTWSVRYRSGACVTVKATDYGDATLRASFISPHLVPISIVLQD